MPYADSAANPAGVLAPAPDKYGPPVWSALLTFLGEGKPLAHAARDSGLPLPTVYARVQQDPAFRDLVRQAESVQADHVVADLVMDEAQILDPVRTRIVQDNRKWLAARLNPAKYGEKQSVELTATLDITSALAAARGNLRPMRGLDLDPNAQTLEAQAIEPTASTNSLSVAAPSEADDAPVAPLRPAVSPDDIEDLIG